MRYSESFAKASKNNPQGSDAANAFLLTKGGFVHKQAAGLYNFLPLGMRVLNKINGVIRQEMDAIGAQEIQMPVMSQIDLWKRTNRDKMNVLFRVPSQHGCEYALNPTTEEPVTQLVKDFISSHRDLPFAVYQIADKFRDELRAKSGILRGKEFNMKDLYSFHRDEDDLNRYYDMVTEVYHKIYRILGIGDATVLTYASGGDFSQYSHEFQTLCPVGEDTVYLCENCRVAVNKEIIGEQSCCPECSNPDLVEHSGVEVGNIFKLRTRFSQAFDLVYNDGQGNRRLVEMGSYGIGPSRTMGAIVELHHDERGIVWPDSVAPYQKHLISIGKEEEVLAEANRVYDALREKGHEVLFDDRANTSAGEKFSTADLIGIPERIVLSKRLLQRKELEVKRRNEAQSHTTPMDTLLA